MNTVAQELNLTVGAKAYIRSRYSNLLTGTVERITPTGQVIVLIREGYSLRFDRNGVEMGETATWRRGSLISLAAYEADTEASKRKEAGRALDRELSGLAKMSVDEEGLVARLQELAAKVAAYQAK